MCLDCNSLHAGFARFAPGAVVADLLEQTPTLLFPLLGGGVSYVLLSNSSSVPLPEDPTWVFTGLGVGYGVARIGFEASKTTSLSAAMVGALAGIILGRNLQRTNHENSRGFTRTLNNAMNLTNNATFTAGQGFPGPLNVVPPNAWNFDYNPKF